MVKSDLKLLKNRAKKEIKKAESLKELDEVFKRYLGKRGEISQILKSLEKLPKKKRVKIGKSANQLKIFCKLNLTKKPKKLKKKQENWLKNWNA